MKLALLFCVALLNVFSCDGVGILSNIGNLISDFRVFDRFIQDYELNLNSLKQLIKISADFLEQILGIPPPVPYLDPDEWWGDRKYEPQDQSIRPFHVEFNNSMIVDLRNRMKRARPYLPSLDGKNVGQNYGTHTDLLHLISSFWYNKYDFKAREKYLNQYEHYITNIQGLDIHFVHVQPKNVGNKKVLPVLLLHGGQTTFREFFDVIPYLTNPETGYDFVFEAIIPSLPGHGYSETAHRVGLGFHKIAVIMRNLMQRLGFKQYYIQAGDWGHATSTALCVLYPEDVLGYHSNLPVSFRPRTVVRWILGALNPSSVVEPEYEDRLYPLTSRFYYYLTESGYFHLEATKPDTAGEPVDQSPDGLISWFLENLVVFTNYDKRNETDGNIFQYIPIDAILDTLTLYWSTKTAKSSFRLYAESTAFLQDPAIYEILDNPAKVPFGALKFRYELVYMPDSFLKDKFPYLIHSTTLNFGGHFAGQENPDVLAMDFFRATEKFLKYNQESNRYKQYNGNYLLN